MQFSRQARRALTGDRFRHLRSVGDFADELAAYGGGEVAEAVGDHQETLRSRQNIVAIPVGQALLAAEDGEAVDGDTAFGSEAALVLELRRLNIDAGKVGRFNPVARNIDHLPA